MCHEKIISPTEDLNDIISKINQNGVGLVVNDNLEYAIVDNVNEEEFKELERVKIETYFEYESIQQEWKDAMCENTYNVVIKADIESNELILLG